ncbi:unnamed protein product [Boreogadus saida]
MLRHSTSVYTVKTQNSAQICSRRVSSRASAAAPCGPGTVNLGSATTPSSPAMPRERMNEWSGNHGHRGPGNADSTKTDRTQRPN